LVVFALGAVPASRAAVDPATVQAASAALPAVRPALRLVKDVAAVPLAAVEILRLPLGIAEVLMCPLPDIEAREGFRDIGKGLAAPFRLIGATLNVPASAVRTVLDIGGMCPDTVPAVLSAAPGVVPAGRHAV
jgi:hypothetical protein